MYKVKIGISEELHQALEKVVGIQRKAKMLFKEDGRLIEIGMRDVKACEYALRELIEIHGPSSTKGW